MKTSKQQFGFTQKVLVLALLAAIGPAHADDDEVARLSKPDSTVVSLGLGLASGDKADRAVFGQYSGLRKNDGSLLIDGQLIKRDDATGLWTTLDVSGLGLDNRELNFVQYKQGDWKYSVGYSELVRQDPRTVVTTMDKLGTLSPTVDASGTASSYNPQLKRKSFTLGGERWLAPNLMLEASLKRENKDGARMSALGGYCSSVIAGYPCSTSLATAAGSLFLLPEPVDASTTQIDAKLNYVGDKFLLSAGYYGSFYNNANSILTPTISTGNADVRRLLGAPTALAPDNSAHQVFAAGNVSFSPTLRANFRVAYTQAKQDDSFNAALSPAAGLPANLGGAVDSTFAQVGATAKPMDKLTVTANWRYEDIEDNTTLAKYNSGWTNALNSMIRANGKVDATYRLPDNFRVTAGADYTYVKRNRPVATTLIPTGSLTSLREETEEANYRIELRRSMSATFNAAVSVSTGAREGTHWMDLGKAGYPIVRYSTIYTANGAFPLTMMDRTRDKVRLMGDWMPVEALSLQFNIESGKDSYTAPTAKGLHSTDLTSAGIDVAYTLSEAWKLNGYLSYADQGMYLDQSWGYMADLTNTTGSFGLGLSGKLSSTVEVGADLSYLNDKSRYGLGSGNADPAGVLPDVSYKSTSLKLFGKYAVASNADVRVDFIHQRVRFNEWSWGYGYALSDGTTVSMQPNQNVTFLGARYIYRMK